jgi:tetratricopeptide (TPR) repeat protein
LALAFALGLTPALSAQDTAPEAAPGVAPRDAVPQPQDTPAPRPQGGLPAGQTRESMWPAPTAEDWQRPCLIHSQRTFADAQEVSRETGKPILICVNMDGEIASEHYAGIRYRQPEIAALYEPYVCVIASVYRHTPRDYDELGRRVPCPRFGTVTCGEHIAIEPQLYEKYFDGRRIAPRHIALEQDLSKSYDVYYAWTTQAVFDSVRDLVPPHEPGTAPGRLERTLPELVASRDSTDRGEVEKAYEQGDPALQKSLLEAAIAAGSAPPLDLLRLAIHGGDPEMAALARKALAQSASPEAVSVITESLRVTMDTADREALMAALDRLGPESPRAKALAIGYRGLTTPSTTVALQGLGGALAGGATYPASPASLDTATRSERLGKQDEVLKSDDAASHVELAEAFLSLAQAEPDPQLARPLFMDARRAGQQAEALGDTGARLGAALALADYYLGDLDQARQRAAKALSEQPAEALVDPKSRDAAVLLTLFAQSRQQAIADAVKAKKDWPGQWLADVHATYAVLAQHPFGDDSQVLMDYDFLQWFGAGGEAARVLTEGLRRFPDSATLHDRLRARLLAERGVHGLEQYYESRLREPDPPATLEGFSGCASLVAAEYLRRSGAGDEALSAYDRGIAHYERAIAADPASRSDSETAIAMALAGRARVAFERGEDAGAVQDLLAAIERKPEVAGEIDGLSVSAVTTSQALMARLRAHQQNELADRLAAALGTLKGAALEPPPYERGEPGEPPPEGSAPRRGAPQR